MFTADLLTCAFCRGLPPCGEEQYRRHLQADHSISVEEVLEEAVTAAVEKIKITEETLSHFISMAEDARLKDQHSQGFLFAAISKHIQAIPGRQRVIDAANALDLSPLEPSLARQGVEDIPELLTEYKKFLAIKVVTGDVASPQSFSPGPLVDQVWHEHLLLPRHYLAACRALGEGIEVIDHDPGSARDNPEEKAMRITRTRVVYKDLFGQGCLEPPTKVWGVMTGSMEIFGKTQDGDIIPIQVDPNSSVARLKLLVQDFSGYLTADQQRLVFAKNWNLENDRTLASYKITKGSTFNIIFEQSGC